MTKSTEECTVDEWAAEFRKIFEEFVATVKRNPDDEYPATAYPGEWGEWLLIWEGGYNVE